MGKTTRWLKTLFGIKISRKHPIPTNSATSGGVLTPVEVACLRPKYYQDETDRNNSQAIAVAAAEVVRLTCRKKYNLFAGDSLNCAAVRIQTNFRGYLARKAVRALKGVVKVQALVRGYLVRKQASATLHGIQALFRAQATVQSIRALAGLNKAQARPFRNWLDIAPTSTAVRSRRLSAIDQDILEVDMGQIGSRSGRIRPGPNSSFSDTLEYNDHPNYMANTMSFMGKVRSQSAPKQRAETMNGRRRSVSDRKRMPLKEIIKERRSSLSEVTSMQRSSSHLEEAISLKNVVIGNIGKFPF